MTMETILRMTMAERRSMKIHRRRNPTGLTYKQKRALAAELIQAAGAIVENLRSSPRELSQQQLDPDEAASQLALWLKDLPGEYWDKRLGRRNPLRDKLRADLERLFEAAAQNAQNTAEAKPGVKVPGFDL
jgi:hypothetical protein